MNERMDYIARDDCGCVVSIMAADNSGDMYRQLAKWADKGVPFELVPVKQALELFCTPCPHKLVQASLLNEVSV